MTSSRGRTSFVRLQPISVVAFVALAALAGLATLAASSSSHRSFDAARAFDYLLRQCAFGPRSPGSRGHAECRDYLAAWFERRHVDYRVQEFVHVDSATGQEIRMTNFLAVIQGTDRSLPPILFCAHWDTRPRADREGEPSRRQTPIIGANDGASGVAVLLEVADILSTSPPPQTVYVVLFDGEDYGTSGGLAEYFLGSSYFAQHLPVPAFRFGILLDMVGDRDLELPYEGFSLDRHPELTRRVWDRARALGLDEFEDEEGPWVYDDHLPLLEKGVPMVDIIDFAYPYWHTLQDIPERCSAESLGVVGELVVDVAYGGLGPPATLPPSSSDRLQSEQPGAACAACAAWRGCRRRFC